MGNLRPKVLVVGMLDSIHVARWLGQFDDEYLDLYLFPSSPNRRLHPKLVDLIRSGGRASFQVHWSAYLSPLLWVLDRFLANFIRGSLLDRWVRVIQPSFVHAIEIQGAGYLTMRAEKTLVSRSIPLMVTNWGSDIYWFQRFQRHKKRIRRLLSLASFYAAECERDVPLALEHGFVGKILPVIPNAGGINSLSVSNFDETLKNRTLIAVKGYDGWVGRARVALLAFELIETQVSNLEIVVFSANVRTIMLAARLRRRSSLKIRVFPKNRLSHAEMQKIFYNSLVYVGVSESDGISTSMLEAMAAGAIPVQTHSSCCEEWFKSSGVSIKKIDPESVAAAILLGLSLARDSKNALTNLATIRQKANREIVSELAKQHYEAVLMASDR